MTIIRDSILGYLGEVTVAPVTSTVRDIPSEVVLGREDGMPRACAINLDHIQTVSRGRTDSVITELSPARMQDLRRAILFALGL